MVATTLVSCPHQPEPELDQGAPWESLCVSPADTLKPGLQVDLGSVEGSWGLLGGLRTL